MTATPPTADPEAELETFTQQKFFENILAGGAKSVERARTSGQLVQAAAAAMGTLYSGVLAVTFAADAEPLPWRGLLPTFFLGLAVVLGAFYTAFLTRAGGIPQPTFPPGADATAKLYHRAVWFMSWSNRTSLVRAPFLRAAVVSLAIGLVLLPAPFLGSGNPGHETVAASEWPDPAFREPVELAAVVYQAQVDDFKAQLEAERAERDVGDLATDVILLLLAVVGLALVGVTLLWKRVAAAWPTADRFAKWLAP